MADRQLYITRMPEDDLYAELRRRTQDELQRLAGEVWTDFNPGDPGVTVSEAADYALTESDYKFGFALEDYLAGADGTWTEEDFGLFPAGEVYPSAPVTAEDYRRLVLANFPMLENVTVSVRSDQRQYDFRLRLSPFFTDGDRIRERAERFLNRHRNLCERIGEIAVEQPVELSLHADFEISPGRDATDILVQVYRTAMHYLAGSVEIVRAEDDAGPSMKADEWYDGPVKRVRADIPYQRNTESELYWKLKQIPGIVSFRTCWFKDRDGDSVTDFRAGYSLRIPETFDGIVVRCGEEEADMDIQTFRERLRARYFMQDTFRTRSFMQERETAAEAEELSGTRYPAVYRDVYTHHGIAEDLPSCYATSGKDFLHGTPPEEKARILNFGNYLKLFDLVLKRGLKELDGLKEILSLKDTGKEPCRTETLSDPGFVIQKDSDHYRPVAALRHRYMDFLDGLYGVDSNPVWLHEADCYGQTESDHLRRRMRFLGRLPRLVRDRFLSFDMNGSYGGENVPTVKKYLSLLLDFNAEEENAVGNILPSHNLILMGDGEKGKHLRGLMNSHMIDDEVFAENAVEAVEENEPPRTKEEKLKRDEDLRRNLPIFNSNWISGSLFREGIVLGNYNLVRLYNREWLLVFRGKEEESRMNLGRSDNKERLNEWANTLCRYLRELNRQCEAVYVVEKGLIDPGKNDTVMMVFTGWTARTRSPRFRKACTDLARSILPAHLKMETYWLGAMQMQYFEECHRKWRESFRDETLRGSREQLGSYMIRILENEFVSRYGAAERKTGHDTD